MQAVRNAHADLSLATDRHRLATETAELLARINTLTQSRLAKPFGATFSGCTFPGLPSRTESPSPRPTRQLVLSS